MDLADGRVWLAVLAFVALAGSVSSRCEPVEFRRADKIQAKLGKEAALRFLLTLPEKNPQYNYQRLRKIANLEDALESGLMQRRTWRIASQSACRRTI